MDLAVAQHEKMNSLFEALRRDRLPWWPVWRELAEFYIPKRYKWLSNDSERTRYVAKNGTILDGTGTKAGRVLAAGMMNGITSPSRPWFKLRIPGFDEDMEHDARVWLDEVEGRMMKTMAETNFYNAFAMMYIDLVFFGSAAVLIYEDYESVFRCYNNALGEFYLGQDDRMQVSIFAREFSLKVRQVVEWWGLENCSDRVKTLHKTGGASAETDVKIKHLITKNTEKVVRSRFQYVETYWEEGEQTGKVLAKNGYFELPGVFPRWELTGNDSYGTSPALDALGDVIQLQHETRRKGQSLDYMVRPPMVMDIQLKHRPTALLPGGQTFVAGTNGVGAKPAYEVRPPIAELTADIRDVQTRIRETFHNDLFQMISQLETVRTATEIDARREEKLVQLGPVLERFENEALDPAIKRIFGIMQRAGLFPDAPESLQGRDIEIQYVSILASAQSAVGVIPTERFLQLVGNLAGVFPEALELPNVEELLRDYARDTGVKAKGLNSREMVAKRQADRMAKEQADQAMAAAPAAAQSAKLLSETQVGGGANALQAILGG
jgi:hypothetical protein